MILEYNAIFGSKRNISIPYYKDFNRFSAHYSGKYFGASLGALNYIADQKGYNFIGCNSAGNNAYFILKKHEAKIPKTDILDGFQEAGFREARNKYGKLIYSDAIDEAKDLKGMKVINVLTKQEELI